MALALRRCIEGGDPNSNARGPRESAFRKNTVVWAVGVVVAYVISRNGVRGGRLDPILSDASRSQGKPACKSSVSPRVAETIRARLAGDDTIRAVPIGNTAIASGPAEQIDSLTADEILGRPVDATPSSPSDACDAETRDVCRRAPFAGVTTMKPSSV